jgi:hypothetical protein
MTTDDIHDYRDPILPGDDEGQALAALQAFLESDGGNGLALVGSDGEQVPLPDSVAQILRHSTALLSTQRAVSLVPMGLKVGPEQASRILQLPLATVFDLIASGELASCIEDEMCWIVLEDVLGHLQTLRHERSTALDELARLSQELGHYESHQT